MFKRIEELNCGDGHNILRLFDILPNFSVITIVIVA